MSSGTDSASAAFIRSHLNDDMEEIAQQPNQASLRPALSPFLSADGCFKFPDTGSGPSSLSFILQVMSIKDVSLSREQRSRALVRAADLHNTSSGGGNSSGGEAAVDDPAALVDATLQAMEDQNDEAAQQHAPLRPSGGQWRCLRLELSDGFQRVLAVEDVSARTRQQYGAVFAPAGLALGSKVVLRLSASSIAAVQHGVLRLHAGNTEVLGGRVRALELFWEAQARQQLAASTGRPSRQQPQQHCSPHSSSPPPPHDSHQRHTTASLRPPPSAVAQSSDQASALPLVQPLRQWAAHVAQNPPQSAFVTVAFITEVVSDMVINEPSPTHSPATSGGSPTACTYALLAQLSSPDAVERETQQHQMDGAAAEVTADDHLTVDLGHAWLRQLVGMPAEDFRALSLSAAPADVARLTRTVEAVGQALEQFGKGRFTLVQRAGDGIVEVMKATPEG
ncbi:hypothetical protein ABB37_05456 [Leptomonas pyrrhocoris]|uniref:RecQ-mediated genome instability protein 1 n=1 Tax=Leptomonas pyrrhocoris TaxID=157538 RepID=A0A0M9G0H6_LEPPY|nr:hypothetical protein ABB37_05456 [Leptomonas pyrrhocoris]XP_015658116.1 hypothetical protein ABB37_05456 [Leptomonas pyrrhocoris]KPA79676.1 hypothetical protein ABB37_05456 [Leptomonas pyrrhocoris]KPA79677.1 hypothetical protein ABB37_05456 [Leptomonas pyrrhocoris]|eukprot:XP_015658115.1 hypothetical protein ABB37_05456 [Leptomonas pyrrhocoris]